MFCAFDLETTGLDPQRDQILQIGAVLFTKDGVIDEFETLVRHDRYEGDPFALQMNAAILKRLAAGEGAPLGEALLSDDEGVARNLGDFLTADNIKRPPHPVGFNVGSFDIRFLPPYAQKWFHHRCVELGSVFMADDGTPGTSNKVVQGLLGRKVAHDALQDARDAAELYMGRLNGKW